MRAKKGLAIAIGLVGAIMAVPGLLLLGLSDAVMEPLPTEPQRPGKLPGRDR